MDFLNLTNKNTEYPIKFEFHKNNENVYYISTYNSHVGIITLNVMVLNIGLWESDQVLRVEPT